MIGVILGYSVPEILNSYGADNILLLPFLCETLIYKKTILSMEKLKNIMLFEEYVKFLNEKIDFDKEAKKFDYTEDEAANTTGVTKKENEIIQRYIAHMCKGIKREGITLNDVDDLDRIGHEFKDIKKVEKIFKTRYIDTDVNTYIESVLKDAGVKVWK